MVEVKQHTKNINGKKVIVKPYTRKEPILSAKDFLQARGLKAPLEKSSTDLPVTFSINVPATNYDKELTKEEFNKRVLETKSFLSKTFGGDTSVKAEGGYVAQNGDYIKESIVSVETSMSKDTYLKNKDKLDKFIQDKKNDWKQESIGFKFEDDLYIYPKFD